MKASDVRKGHVLIVNGQPCRVMDYQHRTPGNLRAFMQVRMRNLLTGNTFEQRFSATEDVETGRLDTKDMQVLYHDGTDLHVMDASTYEQFTLDGEVVGELGPWLVPETRFLAEWLGGKPISIQLPSVVELAITDTTPVVRGATKTASTKPATLENGVTIQVPEFVENGTRVRVNPNTSEYLERAR